MHPAPTAQAPSASDTETAEDVDGVLATIDRTRQGVEDAKTAYDQARHDAVVTLEAAGWTRERIGEALGCSPMRVRQLAGSRKDRGPKGPPRGRWAPRSND